MTNHAYHYNESGYTHDDECSACTEPMCSAGHYIGPYQDCGICKCGANYGAHQTTFPEQKKPCPQYRNHDTGRPR